MFEQEIIIRLFEQTSRESVSGCTV